MHTLLTPFDSRSQAPSNVSAELALHLLGPSTAMASLWSQVRRLAPHARTVLLTGGMDCGQEAVAKLLLDLSPCPQRTFAVLREPETEEHLARACSSSTSFQDCFLFLPELHRLSLAGQHSLLRLLRTRRTRAVSVVVATAEDLHSMVSLGRFLPELAEMLGAVRIGVPALKNRVEDLPMLLAQMLSVKSQSGRPLPQLSEELLRAAMQHSWPGNLKELAHVAESLLKRDRIEDDLRTADLLDALGTVRATPAPAAQQVRMVKLDTVVQEHIYAVLRGCRGNKLRAAEVLGISRSTLYRMLDAAAQNSSYSIAS